ACCANRAGNRRAKCAPLPRISKRTADHASGLHYSGRRMKRSSPVLATVVAFCCAYCGIAAADAPGWLPLRDQNPFVLGAGIPLPPETPDHASGWRLDGYVAEAN